MAISGCDFVCKNNNCEFKGAGVVVTSPWPLGEIDRVIKASNVKRNAPFQKGLIELKNKGRKYSCISLPNKDKIPVVGYRVNMWCDKCLCLHTYDAMIQDSNKNEDQNKVIDDAKISENCPTCNTKMRTFGDVTDKDGEGIQCTSCHTRLQANVWFSNEQD